MTWFTDSWQHMASTYAQAKEQGLEAAEVSKVIDKSYPYSCRSGYAYKAWLAARKDFFRKHNIPLRHAKPPQRGLFL